MTSDGNGNSNGSVADTSVADSSTPIAPDAVPVDPTTGAIIVDTSGASDGIQALPAPTVGVGS